MKMLDMFCCEGIGAMGYEASGLFSSIVGIDIVNRKGLYPYEFLVKDAMKCDYEFLALFDFIHASPPCQGYSKATPGTHKHLHPRLVAATHTMLFAANRPYVIENVEGSGRELRPNLVISGHDVGLPMERRRYFHVNGMKMSRHTFKERIRYHFEKVQAKTISPNGAEYIPKKVLIKAFGLDEMPAFNKNPHTRYGIEQGIPPRMTQAIASILFGKW